MPVFQAETILSCTSSILFDFLAKSANLLLVSPPDLKLELDAPDRLELGSVMIVKSRRWGVVQRMISCVTRFESERLIVDEQRHGPFRRFLRSQQLVTTDLGVRLVDRVEFEAPGGFLGMALTADRISRDLNTLNEYRVKKLKELLLPPAPN